MEKPFYQSKTFWASILGACGAVSTYLLGTATAAEAFTAAMMSLAIFFNRLASK